MSQILLWHQSVLLDKICLVLLWLIFFSYLCFWKILFSQLRIILRRLTAQKYFFSYRYAISYQILSRFQEMSSDCVVTVMRPSVLILKELRQTKWEAMQHKNSDCVSYFRCPSLKSDYLNHFSSVQFKTTFINPKKEVKCWILLCIVTSRGSPVVLRTDPTFFIRLSLFTFISDAAAPKQWPLHSRLASCCPVCCPCEQQNI